MKINEEIKDKNPFKVPEGYFETLTERTMSAVLASREKDSDHEVRAGRTIRLRPFLALAAAIVGVAILSTVMVRLINNNAKSFLTGSESEFYAELLTEEIDTYMIEDEWSLTDSTEYQGDVTGVPAEAIIDFLVKENIDINDIYELL
ncbi:MAG: hypothetical protein MUC78_13410 [Bacteroidales bacterium]|jgi:hypothetical protein|nr:hypothetical protein [Bacteroidales bacterium]